jgi:hypothetical protein
MSRTIQQMIFAKAAEIWTPKNRAIGSYRKRDPKGHVRYCAMGVISQARKEVGVKAKDFPTSKLIKLLGYESTGDLICENDRARFGTGWPDSRKSYNGNNNHQNAIHAKFVEVAKAEELV